MRDRAKVLHCSDEVRSFEDCCKASSILMVVKCRKQNEVLKSCLEKWYKNETFREECKKIYLAERADFRRTGIVIKNRKHEDYLMNLERNAMQNESENCFDYHCYQFKYFVNTHLGF